MANKNVSIKDASDKELDDLLIRLRKENETQNLIRELKLKSLPRPNGYGCEDPASFEGISTETPIKDLYHFGIPGMKWGIRKSTSIVSSLKARSEKDASTDHIVSRQLKSKSIKKLTNSELQTLSQRLQLERSVRDLKSSDYQRGTDFIKTATAIGTTLATAYALSRTPLAKDLARVIFG